MKRSEMVQKLDDALMNMKPPSNRLEATANILEIIESLGMLPPITEIDDQQVFKLQGWESEG